MRKIVLVILQSRICTCLSIAGFNWHIEATAYVIDNYATSKCFGVADRHTGSHGNTGRFRWQVSSYKPLNMSCCRPYMH